MDKFRRCEIRNKEGHRCTKHLYHLQEVPANSSTTGTELTAKPEGERHRAFGHKWKDSDS